MNEIDISENRYKFIHFVKIQQKAKTAVWSCRNNKSGFELGTVAWYGPWRQYCFFPSTDTVFSKGCLDNIGAFMVSMKPNTGRVGIFAHCEGW